MAQFGKADKSVVTVREVLKAIDGSSAATRALLKPHLGCPKKFGHLESMLQCMRTEPRETRIRAAVRDLYQRISPEVRERLIALGFLEKRYRCRINRNGNGRPAA